MECDSFESIVDYLKSTLPALSQSQMEQTIAKVLAASKMQMYEILFQASLKKNTTLNHNLDPSFLTHIAGVSHTIS